MMYMRLLPEWLYIAALRGQDYIQGGILMNYWNKKRAGSVVWTALLITLTILVLACTMTLGIAAADGDTYTLKLAATLYDEYGDEWPVGIQVELAEGDTIDTDALYAELVARYPHMEGTALSTEGYANLPADGKMPAQDLTLTATYEIRPYTITWIVESETIQQKVAYNKVPVFDGIPAKAATAQYTYTFAGWDTAPVKAKADATYTATFTATLNEYDVTWIVDGNETTVKVPYGTVPSFAGSTDKAADVQYTYTFAGWDVDPVAVTGNATYTATYTNTVNEYDVTWIVDGNKTTVKVPYGTVPTFFGTPSKAPDDQYTYTFAGWSPAVVAVTGDATYTAIFDNSLNTVSVTFRVEGQADVILVVNIGETPVYPNGTPNLAATVQYTYTFVGWNKQITEAVEDTVYTAVFTAAVNKYTVTWNVNGVETKVQISYGIVPVFGGSTDKDPDAQYAYTFTGWDKEIVAVVADATYTAQYTKAVRSFNVTFNYGDGKTETVTVEYGKGATAPANTDKAATDTYTYTFKGWDADFSKITADLTVNALYEETPVKEPETTEPDTEAPEDPTEETTEAPEDPTEETTEAPADPTEETTEAPEDPTEEMTTEEPTEAPTEAPTETEPEDITTDEKGKSWIWIVLVAVVVVAGVVVAIVLIRRKNKTDPDPAPKAEPAPVAPSAPLFIPLGEEIPEEEIPEEVETVEEVAATEVDELMSDKVAEHFLVVSDELGGVGKMGIINVGVISPAYQSGETVTLADLKAKGLIDANIGRLKVLAAGTLDKPLTIKADAFSVQAVKMITLTGGQAIELKNE